MTSQQQIINTPPIHNGSTIDTHQYMNIMMSNMIFKHMSSVFDSNTSLTGGNILKLLAIMSLDEIRKIFMSTIKSIFSYTSENYIKVFEWINNNIFQNYFIKLLLNIFNKIVMLFKKKEEHISIIQPYNKINNVHIELTPNVQFMDSLIKYIKTNDECSYNIINHKKLEISNLKTQIMKEIWNNIVINYNDVKINIYQPIENIFEITKSTIKMNNYTLTSLVPNTETVYDSLADLIFDDKVRDLFENAYSVVKETLNKYIQFNSEMYVFIKNIKENNDMCRINIKSNYELLLHFKFKDILKSLIIMNLCFITGCTYFLNYLWKNIKITNTDINYNRLAGSNLFNYIITYCKHSYKEFNSNNYALLLKFSKDCNENTIESKPNHIIINLSSDKDESDINIIFNNFVKEISSYVEPSTQNKKIKVNIIKIKKTKVINSVPNPDYVVYEEQKANIRDLASKDKDDFTIKEFLLKTPPTKTIETIEIKKEVVIEQINEVYKSFDTLYLRIQDHDKLKKVLYSFMHQMELYEELGLPNKLNVFLSGLPGTGKSSIIQVIASYLQKNIYYCNISDEMTNDDVQMIFDYVIKNSIGGGIIVTEDVDAMTKIVHKRIIDVSSTDYSSTDSFELTTMKVHESKNNNLTLEYLLNLLQGSLTQDGTIFIATTNHKELIDTAFYRDGRFDVKIDMKLCDRYQINCIYKKFMNREVPEDVLERISEDEYSPANIIFRVKDYICSDLSDEAILEPFIN